MNNGYLKNCVILPRPNDKGPLFTTGPNGECIASLDGYAIVPLDHSIYQKMNNFEKKIDNAPSSNESEIKECRCGGPPGHVPFGFYCRK